MSEKEDNCQIGDDCSSGTCAPVSPFSREGLYMIGIMAILLLALFFILYFNGLV